MQVTYSEDAKVNTGEQLSRTAAAGFVRLPSIVFFQHQKIKDARKDNRKKYGRYTAETPEVVVRKNRRLIWCQKILV